MTNALWELPEPVYGTILHCANIALAARCLYFVVLNVIQVFGLVLWKEFKLILSKGQ